MFLPHFSKVCLTRTSQDTESHVREQGNEVPPILSEDQVTDH